MNQSFGIMVNYNYLIEAVEANNDRYLRCGTITVSQGIDQYLDASVATTTTTEASLTKAGRDFKPLVFIYPKIPDTSKL